MKMYFYYYYLFAFIFITRLFCEANPIPVKKALNIMGKIDCGIRPPLDGMAEEFVSSLQEALILGKAI